MSSAVARIGRLLAIAAVVLLLNGAAWAVLFPVCCVCECAGAATQCSGAAATNDCPGFLATCEQATNSTCQVSANATACDQLPQCATAAGAAAAPTLDVTGLAAAVVVLAGLAALRLRRRPATQRSR